MASRQERYFQNYRMEEIPSDNRKGYKRVYIYIGNLYSWDISDAALASVRRRVGMAEIFCLALFLLSALSVPDLNRIPSAAVPALLSMAAWIFELIAAASLLFRKLPLRADDHEYTDKVMGSVPFLRFILLTIASAGCAFHMVLTGISVSGSAVAAGYLLAALFALYTGRLYRSLRLHVKEVPSDAGDV